MYKLIETLKSLLVTFLVVSMLVLWTAYIYIRFDRADTDVAELENDFWIYSDTAAAHIETVADDSFFSPLCVTLMLSGEGYTSAFDYTLTDVLYKEYEALLNEIFSSAYHCTEATEEDWQRALSLDGVMIEYTGELPYTAIAEFWQKDSGYCTGDVCLIERLILFSDSSNALRAISSDSKGGFFSFSLSDGNTPSLIYDFNSNNIAAYTVNEGLIPFEFNLKNGNKAYTALPAEYKLLSVAPRLPDLEANTPLQDTLNSVVNEAETPYLELIADETLSAVLDAFDINPNVTGYYSDADSGLNFVGENMRLAVTPDGTVSYFIADGSLPHITCSSLLDTARTDFTSSEILTAATVFLARLPKKIIGGDAQLLLNNVSYSAKDGRFTFTFGYFYRLSRLQVLGRASAVSLTFNSDGLISARLLPLTVSVSERSAEIRPDRLTTDILPETALKIAAPLSAPEPVYLIEGFNGITAPFWGSKEAIK